MCLNFFEHEKPGHLKAIVSPNLKYLQIYDGSTCNVNETEYNCLLKHCSKLELLLISEIVKSAAIGDNLIEQLLRLQLPYCNLLDRHPSLHAVKALKLTGYTIRNTPIHSQQSITA
uniref:Uncharacterized protein n=1 Tax=Ditylenchus dipsaci TaxID=166011 RepID=A0A915D3A8_9BILA